MAQLIVRNLEEEVRSKLRERAQQHGRSMEEEVREILRSAVALPANVHTLHFTCCCIPWPTPANLFFHIDSWCQCVLSSTLTFVPGFVQTSVFSHQLSLLPDRNLPEQYRTPRVASDPVVGAQNLEFMPHSIARHLISLQIPISVPQGFASDTHVRIN